MRSWKYHNKLTWSQLTVATIVLVLLFTKLATGSVDCPMMYRARGTVCGTDGVTYPSLCELEVARIFDPVLDIGYFGKCTTYCKDIWDPVCGNDLITYSSLCLLEIEARKLSSLEVLHVGKCWSGEDRDTTPVTECKDMKICRSDKKGVRPTVKQRAIRIEVGAEGKADKLRINVNKKRISKKHTAITKKKQQRYANTVEEQWENLGFISR